MSLITKADVVAELQTTVPHSEADIESISDNSENRFKRMTHRTSFSGMAEDDAKHAVLCMVIDRLVSADHSLLKSGIESIKEGDSQIKFKNGKTLDSYRLEVDSIVKDLRLPGQSGGFSHTNETTFYSEEDSE